MRTFVSAAAVLLGLLLAAVGVPAIWVDRNIVQEDGFVALAAPLGNDAVFHQRLAAAAVGSLGAGRQMPEALTDLVRPVLESASESLTTLPGYPAAWEETLRRSHGLSFADPRTLSPEVDASTSLTLDVAPLVSLLAQQISGVVGFPIEAPDRTLINIGQSNQRQLIEQVSAYAPMGYILALGSGVAFVLALVAARRREYVLAAAGFGGLILAGCWALGQRMAGDAVASSASGNEVADIFKREFVAAAQEGFGGWIVASLAAGGILLVLAVLLHTSLGRTRPPRN
ncbi:hypothetical protein [Pseudarthrobacter sp. N5]|uniref:hypothetical protein n=1 Tax=Pseudarthrobacter sp. N5 TaxID=3418416 RepID=UPI003CF94CCA